ARPALDPRKRRIRSPKAVDLPLSPREIEPVLTEVVRATLEQRDPRGPPEGTGDERQILREELILQRPGACRDEHASPGEQRGNEIGEGLACAGPGLDDQHLSRLDRPGHAIRHVHLLRARGEIGQGTLERALGTEDVIELEHYVSGITSGAAGAVSPYPRRIELR